MLVSTGKRNTEKAKKGQCGEEAARNERSVSRFDDSEGGCHVAMNIEQEDNIEGAIN